jgi:tRNA nucleotidyltransferase/poly(A) polymerase
MTPRTKNVSIPLERAPWSDGAAIIRTLREHGHDGYFTGGCVRDFLLGRAIKDIDIATSARPERVEECFEKTVAVGKQFGVVVVVMPSGENIEVATFRNDGAYIDGRRPTTVVFSNAEEDVKRRDFTVNALLYDPLAGTVIDYVDGLADMEKKIIRAVGDAAKRLSEDRLRVLRALRFAAQLDYEIEEQTWAAVQATDLSGLSAERLMDEWFKGLAGERPARWLELVVASGRMAEFCAPLADLSARDERYQSLLAALKRLDRSEKREVACALWLSAAPLTEALAWLERQPLAKAFATDVTWLLRQLAATENFMRLGVADRRRLMQHAQAANLARLGALSSLEGSGTCVIAEAFAAEERAGAFVPLLRANDLIALGFTPGPALGKALRLLEDEQLEGAIIDEAAARARARELLGKA